MPQFYELSGFSLDRELRLRMLTLRGAEITSIPVWSLRRLKQLYIASPVDR